MSEFDNTYMHYEDIPLLGENLLEFLELDPVSTLDPSFTTNPTVGDCRYNEKGLSSGEEIKIDDDFKILHGFLEPPVQYPAFHKQNDYKPFSPGSDSGLSSPGSVWDSDGRFTPSPDILSIDQTFDQNTPLDNVADTSFPLLTDALPELSGLDMSNAFGNYTVQSHPIDDRIEDVAIQTFTADAAMVGSYSSVENPFSGVIDRNTEVIVPETKELLDELGIEVETYTIPSVQNSYKLIPVQQATDVSVTNVISIGSKSNVIPYIIKTDIPAVDCVTESSKPKGGRKRKICSTQERRERKREQNKNAATRYRERKRSEMAKRDDELKALKEKNSSLKDETNRINREIDYLRELLVEVYRLKGLIA